MKTTYKIVILLLIVFSFGESFGGDIKLLRPPQYESYFSRIDRFKDLETKDLTGRWQCLKGKGSSWETVELPSSWVDYTGKVIFRRSLKIDSTLADRILHLVMLGVSRRCAIYFNGEFIAEREGPQVEVILPLKLMHVEGSNILEIEVDNTLDPLNTIPVLSGSLSPANYGGITGDIFLIVEKLPYFTCQEIIADVNEEGETGRVSVTIQIVKSPIQKIEGQFVCRLLDSKGKMVASAKRRIDFPDSLTLRLTLPNPRLWSPSSPELYTLQGWLETEAGESSFHSLKVGFRRFSASDGFRLNGEKIQIMGVKYWEEGEWGRTFTAGDYHRDLEIIRSCGLNAVLLPDPAHPFFLQLCDSVGVMVFQSTSLRGVPNAVLNRERFQVIAGEHFRRMITHDIHHPSVAAWVLGLDFEGALPLRFLMDKISHLDNHPAFIGIVGEPGRLLPVSPEEGLTDYPVIVTDLGPLLFDDTEKSQSLQLSRTMQDIELWKSADGLFLRNLADFNTGRTILFQETDKPGDILFSGLVKRNRQSRVIHRRFQSGWLSLDPIEAVERVEPEAMIFPLLGLGLIMIFILYIRRNHVFKVQFVRVFAHPHGFYQDISNRRFKQKMQTGVVGFGSILVLALLFSGILHRLRYSEPFDYLLGHIFQGGVIHPMLIGISQDPRKSIIYCFIWFLIIYLITTFLFKLTTVLVHQRVTLRQSLTFTFWSSANYLWLAPVTVFFYRGLSLELLRVVEIAVLILFIVWKYSRLVNALRVACSSTYLRVLFIFTLFHLFIIAALLIYLHYECAIFHYWDYFFSAVL